MLADADKKFNRRIEYNDKYASIKLNFTAHLYVQCVGEILIEIKL